MKFLFQPLKLRAFEITADLVKFSLGLAQSFFIKDHLTARKQGEGIQKFSSGSLALDVKRVDLKQTGRNFLTELQTDWGIGLKRKDVQNVPMSTEISLILHHINRLITSFLKPDLDV